MSSRNSAAPDRVSRRRVFASGLGAVFAATFGLGVLGPVALGVGVRAHTPYRQWQVYRKRHLLIVGTKTDPEGYDTARALASALAEHLPDSKARPSRAADLERLASLVATKQMDVAVLTPGQAAAFLEGRDPFRGAGAVPLRALFQSATHVLVCRDDFPAPHAYLVAQALDQHRAELAVAAAAVPDPATSPVPLHAGAIAYRNGAPMPGAATLGQEPEVPPDAHPHPQTEGSGTAQ